MNLCFFFAILRVVIFSANKFTKIQFKKNYNNFEKKNESPHARFNPCAQNENSFHLNFTEP